MLWNNLLKYKYEMTVGAKAEKEPHFIFI